MEFVGIGTKGKYGSLISREINNAVYKKSSVEVHHQYPNTIDYSPVYQSEASKEFFIADTTNALKGLYKTGDSSKHVVVFPEINMKSPY